MPDPQPKKPRKRFLDSLWPGILLGLVVELICVIVIVVVLNRCETDYQREKEKPKWPASHTL